MKKYYMIAAAAIVLLGIVFSLRLLSGEDDWICENGQWTKHGNPSAEKPETPCGGTNANNQQGKTNENEDKTSGLASENNNQIIGGPCSYEKFDGKCEVVDVVGKETVRFKFTPNEAMDLKNIGWAKESDILGKVYEESNDGIKNARKGRIFDCQMELITKGTCTPAIFSFN